MNKLFRRLIGLITSVALAAGMAAYLPKGTATAADVSSLSAKQIAQQMGAGWNLGNTLDATGGSGLGSETSWGNPKATQALFKAVKAQGFNTVRIPVTWGNHLTSGNTIDPSWFSRVHTVVDWAMAEGFFVILNIHHEDGWLKPKESQYSAVSTKLKELWSQIAREFAGYDKHLIFEGMNEPRDAGGAHEWDGGDSEMRSVINKLNADFVSTIRATGGINATRALMVPTYAASNTSVAMGALSLPNDSNLIVSVHAYTPYYFAMTNYKKFDTNMQNQLKGFFNDLDKYFINKGIPVCIGEFGASNYGNDSERAKWAASFAKQANSRKVPIVIWDNNVITNPSRPDDCYGIFNRKTNQLYEASTPLVNSIISEYTGKVIEQPYSPSIGIQGSSGKTYEIGFKSGDQKVSVSISGGCSYFTDLGSVAYGFSAPTVTVSSVIVNGEYLVPVGKQLVGSDSSKNTLASVKGEGKVNGKIYEVSSGGTKFGFYGNGGSSVSFKVNGNVKAVTSLDYILTSKLTPALLGAREYNQFSAVGSDGTYAQRHVLQIKENIARGLSSIKMNYTASGFSKTGTADRSYLSLNGGGKKYTAPDGSVFYVTSVKQIKNSSYPQSKGLKTECVLAC